MSLIDIGCEDLDLCPILWEGYQHRDFFCDLRTIINSAAWEDHCSSEIPLSGHPKQRIGSSHLLVNLHNNTWIINYIYNGKYSGSSRVYWERAERPREHLCWWCTHRFPCLDLRETPWLGDHCPEASAKDWARWCTRVRDNLSQVQFHNWGKKSHVNYLVSFSSMIRLTLLGFGYNYIYK